MAFIAKFEMQAADDLCFGDDLRCFWYCCSVTMQHAAQKPVVWCQVYRQVCDWSIVMLGEDTRVDGKSVYQQLLHTDASITNKPEVSRV